MLIPGLCSVTYRRLPVADVLTLATDAGLAAIEWGGDVHAPPADPGRLREVRELTAEHGLTISSYGSYFRAGPHGYDEFAPVLAAAKALGAPRIRIWAGTLGSAEADESAVQAVVATSRLVAHLAAGEGIELGFEFHRDTLTDSVDSTQRLLDAVDAPNVRTYWQPPVAQPEEEAVAGLETLLDRVCALHVFSWWPGTTRLPLADRTSLWRAVFAVAGGAGRTMDALLEFVPGDTPEALAGEAGTLRELIATASS